jgi:FAD/FMN-containing dehydrogenase
VDEQVSPVNRRARDAFSDGFLGEIVLPVRGIYGSEKYERLLELKRAYDPDNVSRLNQSIRP